MPVCPDYAYVKLSHDTFKYTFDSVGNGVGLVANKALQAAHKLESIFSDSPCLLNLIKFTVLVGDFEAKPHNLKSFSLTYCEFMDKIKGTVQAIKDRSGYNVSTFISLCRGFENWLAFETAIKTKYKIHSFDCLLENLPHIDHEKNLISRIPLYSKWFHSEQRSNYKDIFFDQVVEYVTMGELLRSSFGPSTVIMACDHRAMRKYYNPFNSIPTVGVSNDY